MTQLTTDEARKIFDILVEECGASEKQYAEFESYMLEPDPYKLGKEFRFMGLLGTGGKLYLGKYNWRVDCYTEDLTPVRQSAIDRANERLGNIQPYHRPQKQPHTDGAAGDEEDT